jgi:hypothetical protein
MKTKKSKQNYNDDKNKNNNKVRNLLHMYLSPKLGERYQGFVQQLQ